MLFIESVVLKIGFHVTNESSRCNGDDKVTKSSHESLLWTVPNIKYTIMVKNAPKYPLLLGKYKLYLSFECDTLKWELIFSFLFENWVKRKFFLFINCEKYWFFYYWKSFLIGNWAKCYFMGFFSWLAELFFWVRIIIWENWAWFMGFLTF